MTATTVQGREFDIEFHYASQGHRITVREFDGNDWQTIPGYDYVLCLGSTQFETLCNLSAELFGDSVFGEDFALALEIPMISADDAECVKCGTWQHYEDMVHGTDALDTVAEKLGMGDWDYVCQDCYFAELPETVAL
jgi:hypothetical protein